MQGGNQVQVAMSRTATGLPSSRVSQAVQAGRVIATGNSARPKSVRGGVPKHIRDDAAYNSWLDACVARQMAADRHFVDPQYSGKVSEDMFQGQPSLGTRRAYANLMMQLEEYCRMVGDRESLPWFLPNASIHTPPIKVDTLIQFTRFKTNAKGAELKIGNNMYVTYGHPEYEDTHTNEPVLCTGSWKSYTNVESLASVITAVCSHRNQAMAYEDECIDCVRHHSRPGTAACPTHGQPGQIMKLVRSGCPTFSNTWKTFSQNTIREMQAKHTPTSASPILPDELRRLRALTIGEHIDADLEAPWKAGYNFQLYAMVLLMIYAFMRGDDILSLDWDSFRLAQPLQVVSMHVCVYVYMYV
jgi:hypothetical protein